MSFDRFMAAALYHPELGFYASGRTRTGTSGDFLTPVSPGPVLGQLLAAQVEDLHRALGRPRKIRLLEQGADAGWLARDLLKTVLHHYPQLARAMTFHLIEPLPRLAQKQKEALREIDRAVQWHSSWETVPEDGIPSVFYSCELVDSFPVRIFRYREGAWRQQGVGWEGSRFCWQETAIDPVSSAEIHHWRAPALEGLTVELRPSVRTWAQDWTKRISQGLVLTLDYGFPAEELFLPERPGGTLVALRRHQTSSDPLADPGQQDLTAHVNFTELEELAAREGWRNYGLTDFSRGLTALAAPFLQDGKNPAGAWIRNFRHLTHPSFFGKTHKILVQGKALPESFRPTVLGKI